MKQIVVISGKGGTGKTVITGAFAALAQNKVMADCDVDAADLYLLLNPEIKQRNPFKSGFTAYIDKELCTECGRCIACCRFNAVSDDYIVDDISCEGCGFCGFICPQKAIQMKQNTTGEWFVSDTRFGPLVHAKLGIAQENSGKLVSTVRQKAQKMAEENSCDWVIIDGSPGIGCPVIASLSGADCAVVVTEPTLSGIHDAKRVIKVSEHFEVPVKLIVNKYDLNKEMTEKIESYCRDSHISVIGKVSFDEAVVKSMVQAKTIIEYNNSKAKEEIINIWNNLQKGI